MEPVDAPVRALRNAASALRARRRPAPATTPASSAAPVADAPTLTSVDVAGLHLRVPGGCRARLLSSADDRAAVEAFIAASPDATLHHQPAWIEFVRGVNGACDVLLLERDGAGQVALPVNPFGRWTIDVGYAGVLFPPGAREAALRRAARTLRELLDANPKVGLRGIQAAEAPAYDDPDRVAVLACVLEQERLTGTAPWCRAIARRTDLGPFDVETDEAALFAGYETKLRSQIRQARRNGVTVDAHRPVDHASASRVYEEFTAVHAASWGRTGLRPHGVGYWTAMSGAVVESGGQDIVVFARSPDGEPLAVASCHLFADRAIYLSGASIPAGLDARANPLCLHTAILECFASGAAAFELGRFAAVEPNEKEVTITRYKSQFGGHLFRLTALATPTTRGQLVSQQVHRGRRKLRVVRGGEYLYP